MHRVLPAVFICGLIFLLIAGEAMSQTKSWRGLKPFPASRITWQEGFIGVVDNDRTRLYHLTGQGSLGIPFLAKGPSSGEMTARQRFIADWLQRHPQALAVPVEAYPFFSKTVARIYVWVIDGTAHLNLDMVRAGLFRGDYLMTILRFEDLYVTSQKLWAFRKQVIAAEIEAAEAGRGIWADPEFKQNNKPGRIFYPGMEPLSRMEKGAAQMP